MLAMVFAETLGVRSSFDQVCAYLRRYLRVRGTAR